MSGLGTGTQLLQVRAEPPCSWHQGHTVTDSQRSTRWEEGGLGRARAVRILPISPTPSENLILVLVQEGRGSSFALKTKRIKYDNILCFSSNLKLQKFSTGCSCTQASPSSRN